MNATLLAVLAAGSVLAVGAATAATNGWGMGMPGGGMMGGSMGGGMMGDHGGMMNGMDHNGMMNGMTEQQCQQNMEQCHTMCHCCGQADSDTVETSTR